MCGGCPYAHAHMHANFACMCAHMSDDFIMGFPREFPMGAAICMKLSCLYMCHGNCFIPPIDLFAPVTCC